MSIALVRPFFRTRLNALGFKEHTDAFDDQNRPEKKLDKLYRIESGPINSEGPASTTTEFDVSVSLVITLKGKGTNNVDLADRAWVVASEVYEDILDPEVRNDVGIKNIIHDNTSVVPFSASDDNDLILTIDFICNIFCEF